MTDEPSTTVIELAAAAQVLLKACVADPALNAIVQTAYQLGFGMGKQYAKEDTQRKIVPSSPPVGIA